MRGAEEIYCSTTILTLKQEGKKEGSSTAEGSPKIKKKQDLILILETKVRRIHGIGCLGH